MRAKKATYSRWPWPRRPVLACLTALLPLGHQPTPAIAATEAVRELREARMQRLLQGGLVKREAEEVMPAAGPSGANASPTAGESNAAPQPPSDTPAPSAATGENLGSEALGTVFPRPRPERPVAGAAAPARAIATDSRDQGTTFRRAPIEAPILDGDRWEELLYAIEINGVPVSDGELVLRSTDGTRLAVPVQRARAWRLNVDADAILLLGGVPFLPVSEIEGATITVDQGQLLLRLQLPPSAFEPEARDLQEGARLPPPSAATGGFLDYDLVASGGTSLNERVDGLVELGGFSPMGVGTSSFQLTDIGGGTEFTRLGTTLTRDFPARRASLRFGDSLTTGGSFSPSVRFAGLQWASNFATDPGFVPFPLPTIGGTARQQSVVEVVSDNVATLTTEVPAGPFRLGNIPVVTGAGELQVTVTDLLGREQTVTRPYYVSAQVLRQGLHEFAYEIGFERRQFADDSFNYGDLLATTTHRYGVSDGLTLEGQLQGSREGGALIVGGAAMLGGIGVASGGIGISGDRGEGVGYLGQIAFDYNSRNFDLGARTRYTTGDFRQLGEAVSLQEREDQLTAGLSLGGHGRLGILFSNRSFDAAQDARSVTGALSFPVMGGSVSINAAQQLQPQSETAVTAVFSMPLGEARSIAATAERSGGESGGRLQFRQARGLTDLGMDFRIAADFDPADRSVNGQDMDGRLGYNTRLFATSLEFDRQDGDNDLRAGIAGSLALVDGKFGLTRPLGRAFGLVDLPGYPDVQVFLDNREVGRTDRQGRLILPSLRPYEPNKVSLALEDLPLEARVLKGEAMAVPFAGAGITVPLTIAQGRSASVRLIDAQGLALPENLRLRSADGQVSGQVARDGFAQIDGLSMAQVEVHGQSSRKHFACPLPALTGSAEVFPDLGEITCAVSSL